MLEWDLRHLGFLKQNIQSFDDLSLFVLLSTKQQCSGYVLGIRHFHRHTHTHLFAGKRRKAGLKEEENNWHIKSTVETLIRLEEYKAHTFSDVNSDTHSDSDFFSWHTIWRYLAYILAQIWHVSGPMRDTAGRWVSEKEAERKKIGCKN